MTITVASLLTELIYHAFLNVCWFWKMAKVRIFIWFIWYYETV